MKAKWLEADETYATDAPELDTLCAFDFEPWSFHDAQETAVCSRMIAERKARETRRAVSSLRAFVDTYYSAENDGRAARNVDFVSVSVAL